MPEPLAGSACFYALIVTGAMACCNPLPVKPYPALAARVLSASEVLWPVQGPTYADIVVALGADDSGGDARRALASDPKKPQQLNEALKGLGSELGENTSSRPDAESAAASKLTVERSSDMITTMVNRLAERLKQDVSDLDGWIRLVRSYMVLGESDKARAAATDARNALASDADKLRQFDAAVKDLGVKS